MNTKDINDLNTLFKQAEETDRDVFAEMRSNILLVAGEHYSRQGRGESDPRTSRLAEKSDQRLKLTKNKCHRLSHIYTNALLSEDPGVNIVPQCETDMQDRKEAELNKAVWKYIAKKNKFTSRKADWAKNFVDIGEICVKVYWDYSAGDFTGEYEPVLDPTTMEPMLEDSGEMEESVDPITQLPIMIPKMNPVPDKSKPIFTGGFVWEEVLPFNLLRDPAAKSMDDREYPWIVRKMVDTKELKRRYRENPEISEKLNASQDETYVVFDANKAQYDKAEDQTMVREFYWRPSPEYPLGWFCIATKDVVLEEGELPKGRWPFSWRPFNKFQSTPRGRSILKVARPYQVELNRASSSLAEAQITLGSDKLLQNAGAKLTQGSSLPGIRSLIYTGEKPDILPGRDGSQFAPYVAAQQAEMDEATMINEIQMRSEASQMDPYLLMYQSASKRRVYKVYLDSFSEFLRELAEITLDLAKEFLPDGILIPAVGQREIVNLEEFRGTSPLSHSIAVEPGTETLEEQFGKQLTFQHMLQYVGKNLDPATIGKMAKALPYGNMGEAFEDLTLNEDIATNVMLKLERGQPVTPPEYVDPDFMLKKITKKVSSPEFEFFAPNVQQGYRDLISAYEDLKAEQEQKIMAAKNEYIPTDGALVPVQVYVQDPEHPEKKASLARLPYAAVQWLMERLEQQGASQAALKTQESQTLSEMAERLIGNQSAAGASPDGQVIQMPQMAR